LEAYYAGIVPGKVCITVRHAELATNLESAQYARVFAWRFRIKKGNTL